MPWQAKDANKHNHAVKSPARKRQWAATANTILKRTGDDGRAIRGANSAVKKFSTKTKSSRRSTRS